MLDTIVQRSESLNNFVSAFRDAFKNSPQYRHFQAYVLGMIIYLGSKNLAGLSRAIADGKSACSMYRYIGLLIKNFRLLHLEILSSELSSVPRDCTQTAKAMGKYR